MANDLTKHSAGVVENGIDVFNPDFNPSLVLASTSYNMMTGINRGTGPRYGISPIPGHSSKDTTTAANGRGLRASELSTGSNLNVFIDRRKVFGVAPIVIPSYSDFTSNGTLFIWLMADLYNSGSSYYAISASPNVIYTDGGSSPNTFAYTFDISYGFNPALWAQPLNDNFTNNYTKYLSPVVRRLPQSNPSDETVDSFAQKFLKIDSGLYYTSIASISVSGRRIPQEWVIGTKVADGSGTTTATANMNYLTVSGTYHASLLIPSSWQKGNFAKTARALTFYNIDGFALGRTFIYDKYQVSSSTFVATLNQDYTTANYSVSGTPTSVNNLRGAAFTAANVDQVLLHDPEGFCENSYSLVLMAAKGAYGFFMQEWDRDFTGRNVQIAPIRDRFHKPVARETQAGNGVAGQYTENGTPVSTCFDQFPVYAESTASCSAYATASANGTNHFFFGAANTGTLRSNTTYEMTFSFFDKQLGIETNVGAPAKFRTGSVDYTKISLGADVYSGGAYQQNCMVLNDANAPLQSNYFQRYDGTSYTYNWMMNYLEIRFYYRPLGTFEWLPALFIDAAKYFFYTDYQVFWACEGNIAALPGGQPGGFIDYSFLPDDQYDCVLTYKNRSFWLSQKNLVFSLANNSFAYPLRNSAPAPTGGYRGAIVHTYRGQSEQESRMVIFGQKETFIGRFTGVFTQQPVQVSQNTVANYDVDGSDFRVEPWTSITAFSHRAAVVADGDLYWWGPQGVYRDNGVGNPVKVSDNMEPDIFTLYDQSLTAEIHCVYDEKTKHIIWFYPPADANTLTYALTLEVATGQFFIDRFKCKIDWAQRVNTNNPSVTQGTNALRTIIGSRESSAESIQRSYFFDQLNRSGDWSPERELLAKSVSAGSSSLFKVLAFDSGLDATNFATITVGDYIAIQQFKKYTGQATGDDLIATVSAIDTGAGTLTIKLPDDATLPNCTPTERFYFPIWHRAANGDGLNGIPWQWETKYWMPTGVNNRWLWLWLYMFIKYTTWKKRPANTFTAAFRSPTSGDYVSDTITLTDNSDGNFQLFHGLKKGQTNNQGQAIKFKLSGSHIGEEWMIQYLEAHALDEGGNFLKQFQG